MYICVGVRERGLDDDRSDALSNREWDDRWLFGRTQLVLFVKGTSPMFSEWILQTNTYICICMHTYVYSVYLSAPARCAHTSQWFMGYFDRSVIFFCNSNECLRRIHIEQKQCLHYDSTFISVYYMHIHVYVYVFTYKHYTLTIHNLYSPVFAVK